MPRRSAAELATPPRIRVEKPPLPTTPGLTSKEAEAFRAIADSVAPDHFVPADAPLLTNYVRATLLAERSIKDAFDDEDALKIGSDRAAFSRRWPRDYAWRHHRDQIRRRSHENCRSRTFADHGKQFDTAIA